MYYSYVQRMNYFNTWIEFDIHGIIAKPGLLPELELCSQRYILNLSHLNNDLVL